MRLRTTLTAEDRTRNRMRQRTTLTAEGRTLQRTRQMRRRTCQMRRLRTEVNVIQRQAATPDKFSDGDFQRWIRQFEACSDANVWDDATRRRMLPTFLKGRAWAIFERVQRGGAATYQQLRDALSRSFVPDTREQRRLASRQLGERTWKTHESIEQYAREIKRLLDKALPNLDDATREDQLIQKFVAGLPGEISFELEVNPVDTFDQTITRAAELMLFAKDVLATRLLPLRIEEDTDRESEVRRA